jgi:membrane-associated phospholipid phosphatase
MVWQYHFKFKIMPSLIKIVSFYTDFGQVALPTIGGLFSLQKKDYAGVGWLLASVIVNQLLIEFLKRAFNTRRPNGGKWAFPSGNTAAAFLGPFFLKARYGLPLTNSLVSCSVVMAIFVGLGRMWIGVHWPQDIVGGGFLGWAVAQLIPIVTE